MVAPCPLLNICFHLRSEFLLLPHFPVYFLDPSKAMDDRIPIAISEGDFCRLAVREGRPALLLVLAPIVVGLRIFRDGADSMSREQRLEYANFLLGFAIVTQLFKRTNFSGATEKHKSNEPSLRHLWRDDTLQKLLVTMYRLTLLLADPRACYLGSITSQCLEHFWGILKRLAHGDLTIDSLLRAADRYLALQFICEVLNVSCTQPGRERHSGAHLPEQMDIDWSRVPSIAAGCFAALEFYRFALPQFSEKIVVPPCLLEHAVPPRWGSVHDFLAWLPQPVPAQLAGYASSTKSCFTTVRARGPLLGRTSWGKWRMCESPAVRPRNAEPCRLMRVDSCNSRIYGSYNVYSIDFYSRHQRAIPLPLDADSSDRPAYANDRAR
jgi:hypothetical protein